MVERVALVYRSKGRVVDGIRDHSNRLAEELSKRSISVEYGPELGGGVRSEVRAWLKLWRQLRRAGSETAVVIQYSPFCFARWGFAPWLPAVLMALRASRRRPVIAVMIHEPYVPMISWRWTILGLWQRVQLAAIRLSADLVFTSIDPWAKKFAARRPSRPAHHLPVGSNFPYARSLSEGDVGQESATGKSPVVATLARDHRSWLGEYVISAMNEIAASGCTARLLVLGAEAPEMASLHPAIDVEAPGYLEPQEFTDRLVNADLFLIPLEDGISTRRSALMVALQHGLPVVGTAGALTDPILLEADSALRLVPVGDVDGFANEALSLAGDPAARVLAGQAARRLYEKNFDWPVVVDKMLEALPAG